MCNSNGFYKQVWRIRFFGMFCDHSEYFTDKASEDTAQNAEY